MGLSQDVIVKRDGEKIQAKVIEITSSTIKYKKFEQDDGPVRNIKISEVSEIIYDNGDWEKFKQEEVKEEEEETTSRPTRPSRSKRDPLFDSGMYLDLMLGAGQAVRTISSSYINYYDEFGNFIPDGIEVINNYTEEATPPTLSFRIGHKWMFGSSSTYRPGLQVQWMKVGFHINPDQGYASYALSPLNIGLANAIRFNEKHGMEANIMGGFTALNFNPFAAPFGGNPTADLGFSVNAELKYRFDILSIGLDFTHMNAALNRDNESHVLNVVSLTAGIKL